MTASFTSWRPERADHTQLVPAVVVGCSTVGLGIIRSLGRRGVPVTAVDHDESDFAHHSRYVTHRVRAPHPETDPEGFMRQLSSLGNAATRPVLLPASDAALATISRHHPELSRIFRLGVGDWASSRLFIEKRETYRLAENAGVPSPRTVTPQDIGEVQTQAGTLRYPVLVKPSQSHRYVMRFGRKMTEVNSAVELVSAYREACESGIEVMVQEIVSGPDELGVNYNCLVVDGVVVAEFTARKIRNEPPRFGSPSAVVSARVPEVVPSGRAIVEALGIEGFACTEFKLDRQTGEYKLMEVNGRHNLSSALAPECGIDFPWLHYQYLATGVTPHPVSEFLEGVVWIDLVRDLASASGAIRSGELSLRSWLRSYRGRRTFAVISVRDPRPTLVRIGKLLAQAVRRRREP